MKKIPTVPRTDDLDHSHVEQMMGDPSIISLVRRFNDEYYHWDDLRYRVDDGDRDGIWILMKFFRNLGSMRVDLEGLDLTYNLLPGFQECLHDIDLNSTGPGELDGSDRNDARSHIVSSMMEEAIASSQIEGADVTRKEAKHMLRSGRKPGNKGERMVYNNYAVLENMRRTIGRPMDLELIKEMHRTIVKDVLDDGPEWEGRFRESDDVVVGNPVDPDLVFHRPPTHNQVEGLIQSLCDFINDDSGFMHPVLKGIAIHYAIGYIHPFVDGNGRLARSMQYWYMLRRGYGIMEYTSPSKAILESPTKYGHAYQYVETDDGDLTYFLKSNIECMERSMRNLRAYIEERRSEQEGRLESIGSELDLNRYQMMILRDHLGGRKLFSITEIANRYGVSYQTARNHVNGLLRMDLVHAHSKDGKTVLYIVSDNIRV